MESQCLLETGRQVVGNFEADQRFGVLGVPG